VRFTNTLDDLSECDLVAEAAIEDEDAKTAIFAALGKVVRPDALLTSNTSSIPIMKLAAVTSGPERVGACTSSSDGSAVDRSHSM
jgi:3-hydroxybutyryl-CoA dehydrogenase